MIMIKTFVPFLCFDGMGIDYSEINFKYVNLAKKKSNFEQDTISQNEKKIDE